MDERTEVEKVPEAVEAETIHPNRRLWRDVITGTGSDRDGNPRPRYTDDQLKALGKVILEASKQEDQSKWPEWARSYVNGGVPLAELLADLISEVENRSQEAAEIALEAEITSETEFPIAKLLTPEEAKQVLESGRQGFLADKETVSPVSPEEAAKLLETPQQVEYLGKGHLSVVYSFPNIPGWVVKLPLGRNTPKDNLRFPQEEKLLAQIAARKQETGRPRTCPNVLPGYASGEKTLRLVNEIGVEFTNDIAVIMERVEESQRYRKLESYGDSTVENERGVMQTAIRQLLLHGLTLVELGRHESDRTALDYYWDRQEDHIIVLDYNVVGESPDVALLNKAQVSRSGTMIAALAGAIPLISIKEAKSAETAVQQLEEHIPLIDKAIDKPTLEFTLRCFYNNIIPCYQTMAEAIQAYDRILAANAVPNDHRDQEIESALQAGDTRHAYNVAYYSTDDRRLERLSLVLKAAGGKSPYQVTKEELLARINSGDESKNKLYSVNAWTVPDDILHQLRQGNWDKVINDLRFQNFRGTVLESAINLMKIRKEDRHDWLAETLLGDKTYRDRMLLASLKLLKKIPLDSSDLELLRLVRDKLTEDEKKHQGDTALQAKLKIVDSMLGDKETRKPAKKKKKK